MQICLSLDGGEINWSKQCKIYYHTKYKPHYMIEETGYILMGRGGGGGRVTLSKLFCPFSKGVYHKRQEFAPMQILSV